MSVRDADASWAEYDEDREKVEDLLKGRSEALEYIRTLPGHDEKTAKKYRDGAYFLPMAARTSEALGGLVFAKAPTRNLPEALDAVVGDLTRTGQDLDRFAEKMFDAVLATYCVAVVVDYPETPAGMTVLEAERRGIRPFCTLYDGRSILAARFGGAGQERQLAHVRLLEEVEEPSPDDEWAIVSVEQVRVLDLDEAGLYRQRVYREIKAADGAKAWVQYGPTIEPKMAGARMARIPAFFTTPRDAEPSPGIPPLRDIADVNIAHLNDSAAYQWGLIWTANPTPIFTGFNFDDGDVVKMGSSGGITGPLGAKAEFLEFTGTGLTEIRASMEAKRRDGAMMGARLLMEDAKAAIAAETARIQRAGETSIIAGIANAVSECITKALTFLAEWAGIDPTTIDGTGSAAPLEYWLNSDLNPTGLSPQELTALLAAWQAGAITLEDLFQNLQQGEIIDAGKSFADHQEGLAEEGAGLGMIDADDPMTDEPDPNADPADMSAA